tara:strand:- start:179 stop:430 length:252 start_codon:yes stop_codon:yes gene_type:complete
LVEQLIENKKEKHNMKNVAGTINEVAGAFVTLVKGLVVAAIFANILFTTTFDPVGGIVDLVNAFLGGGLAGLLGLMVFASFSK